MKNSNIFDVNIYIFAGFNLPLVLSTDSIVSIYEWICIYEWIKSNLTSLFSRKVAGFSSCVTVSFVGTEPWSRYLDLGFTSSGTPTRYLVAKQALSKCAEQIKDELVAAKSGRCLRTNFTHNLRCSSFSGNLCIDIPSTWYVFVELRIPGPPQTQNVPLLALFALEAMLVFIE